MSPFKSSKQLKYMFANHPDIAQRWVNEAQAKRQPVIQPTKRKKHNRTKRAR